MLVRFQDDFLCWDRFRMASLAGGTLWHAVGLTHGPHGSGLEVGGVSYGKGRRLMRIPDVRRLVKD